MSTSCRSLVVGSKIRIWIEDDEKSSEGRCVTGIIMSYQIKKKNKHGSDVLYTIKLDDGVEFRNRLGNNVRWEELSDIELFAQKTISKKRKQSAKSGHFNAYLALSLNRE